MESFKIEFQECSTVSDSADAEFSELSDLNNSSKACSPLIKEDSQSDEKIIENAFLSVGEKRNLFKKKDPVSMYWKTPGKPIPKGCKLNIITFICFMFDFPFQFHF